MTSTRPPCRAKPLFAKSRTGTANLTLLLNQRLTALASWDAMPVILAAAGNSCELQHFLWQFALVVVIAKVTTYSPANDCEKK